MMKKVFLAVLVLVVTVGTAFATGAAEPGPSPGTPPTATGPGDPFGKYTPPITVTAVRVAPNPVTQNYLGSDSATENEWTRLYMDRLGIDLEYAWMVDQSQWEQRLNLQIASGDLPDVFQVSMVQMHQLHDADLIADLTNAYEWYASPYTKQVMFESGPAQFESAKIDGDLVALPFTGLPKEAGPALMLRDDWLDALGLDPPQNFEEFLEVIEAFVAMDPDGNGEDDTVGLIMERTLLSGGLNSAISLAFRSYPYQWITDDDGEIVYGGIQPETRDLLATLAGMFQDGLIDPEFGSKDFATAIEPLVQGKAGVYMAPFWSPLYPLQALYNNDPSMEIGYYQIPTVDGDPARIYSPLGTMGYWVVAKEAAHPEAAVKMMNLWNEIFYANVDDDVYGELVNRPDGTEVWQNALLQMYRGFKNLDAYYHVSAAYNGEMEPAELTPEERGILDRGNQFFAGDPTMWAWKEIYFPGGIFSVTDTYVEDDLFVEQPYLGPPAQTEIESGTILKDLQDQAFIRIVTGAAPIAEFDEFVTQWRRLGGDAWTAELNEFMSGR